MHGVDDFIIHHKIPIGSWMDVAITYITTHFGPVFDAITTGLDAVISAFVAVLLFPDPLLFIPMLCVVAWYFHRNLGLVIVVLVGQLAILNLNFWKETMETVALVLSSTALCLLIGIPLGILSARRPRLYAGMRPVLDLMQTIPSFVFLIPAMILFGLGVVPALIATIVFAVASPIRLTYLGIRSVPKPLVEAAEAFGATPRQILYKVELPHAWPTLMAGVTQCIMLSLSMVVIAALVGASGLGEPVVRALNTVNIAMGFEAGLCIVILAILLDRLLKRDEPSHVS